MRFSVAAILICMVSPALPADSFVAMSEFALPHDAQPAGADFSGRYLLRPANASAFNVHTDTFSYAGPDSAVRRFPGLYLDVLQDGFDLLPAPAGVIDSGHPAWEIAFQPGKAWLNDGLAQAVLPFALLERNANCTHNGILWFSPGDDTAHYQISSETCAYFKFDMRGSVPLERVGRAVLPADLQRAIARNRKARLPALPFEQIAADFPAITPGAFGAVGDMRADAMTVYGLVVDGRHYRSSCDTRHGPSPYCDEMLLPSYSTAKSLFAGTALMHLELQHPGSSAARISQWVSDCEDWGDVTIEHALDMATGRYRDPGMEADEASDRHVRFLYADNHEARIAAACHMFPQREPPGSRFVYHSSDTYIAGTAMQAILRKHDGSDKDLFLDLVERPLFAALPLSPIARQTRRSYDAVRQPLSGWGLTFVADDFARLGNWFNTGQARIDGKQVFAQELYDAAMQRNPDDRGLEAGGAAFRYNNGFWAHDISAYIGCNKPVWVPFMSGYGGISVVLFPNGITYYYVSDGHVQRWREAAIAVNNFRTMCP